MLGEFRPASVTPVFKPSRLSAQSSPFSSHSLQRSDARTLHATLSGFQTEVVHLPEFSLQAAASAARRPRVVWMLGTSGNWRRLLATRSNSFSIVFNTDATAHTVGIESPNSSRVTGASSGPIAVRLRPRFAESEAFEAGLGEAVAELATEKYYGPLESPNASGQPAPNATLRTPRILVRVKCVHILSLLTEY